MFALFLQDGLSYSPLRSGLTVTPFAWGAAVSSVVAGRLVPRFGRRLTVCGLAMTGFGLAVTAAAVRQVSGPGTAWVVAGPLLLAGLGGGMVASSNLTLTLASVPVAMAGAAGGALQTGQRIGAAIGTAALAAIFYTALSRTAHDRHTYAGATPTPATPTSSPRKAVNAPASAANATNAGDAPTRKPPNAQTGERS